MKNIKFHIAVYIFVFLFLFVSNITFEQNNNLQYFSAKYILLSCPEYGCYKDTIVTIPNGKAWKIESVGSEGGELKLDGIPIHRNNISVPRTFLFPIWLPEGTYTFRAAANDAYNIPKCFISAIEFNIAH